MLLNLDFLIESFAYAINNFSAPQIKSHAPPMYTESTYSRENGGIGQTFEKQTNYTV